MNTLLPKTELERILDDIVQIRTLTSPQIDEITQARDYSALLRRNFEQIRQIAADSIARHERILTPLIQSDEALSDEDADTLVAFCRALLNQTHVAELDLTLVFHLSGRLKRDAEKKNDDEGLIRALFIRINACYANLIRVNRLRVADEMTRFYMEEGLKAADALLPYLSPERFVHLNSDRTRHEVLTMSYFYVALYDVPFVTPEINRLRLDTLIQSYERMQDPFYLEHAPAYNRHTGTIRCLEHMGQLTEYGNAWGYTEEQCEDIASYTEELNALWQEAPEENSSILPEIHLQLLLVRNRYYDGQLTLKQYRGHLITLYKRHANDRYDQYSLFANLFIPTEYLASFSAEEAAILDADTTETIERIYRKLIVYLLHSTNEGAHYFLLEYVSNFLNVFIELPHGTTFLEIGLECLAALYPPTFVHSVMTAQIAHYLVNVLLDRHPEALIGVFGTGDSGSVEACRERIVQTVFFGALCHDFGKLPMLDSLFLFWRKLYPEDRQILAKKSQAGERLLSAHASTRPYAAYAMETDPPEPVLAKIMKLAHDLDDATDTTGRIWREHTSPEAVISSLGARDADSCIRQLYDLLEDDDVRSGLTALLTETRERIYEKTFLLLKTGVFQSDLLPLPLPVNKTSAILRKKTPEVIREMRTHLAVVTQMGEAIISEHDAAVCADHAATILRSTEHITLLTDALTDDTAPADAGPNALPVRPIKSWPAFKAPTARILLLDTVRPFLNAAAAVLKPSTVRLTASDTAQQYLEMVCEVTYDLILIDDAVPLADCVTLLSRTRTMNNSKNRVTPVIALTAEHDTDYCNALLMEGFNGFLIKPFGRTELEELFLKHLDASKLIFPPAP